LELPGFQLRQIACNGIHIQVAEAGWGPAVLLLHGWPFTWFLWRNIMRDLVVSGYKVVAPDLRGIGGSDHTVGGYDLHTLASDHLALLEAMGLESAAVVAFDLSVGSAWMLGMHYPAKVRKLVLIEALLGTLPGAEDFLRNGPPWWFGFHGIPGLAEAVLAGREAEYLGWFFTNQTAGRKGIPHDAASEFIRAYSGKEGLRGGFEHYRAFPVNDTQIRAAAAKQRLAVPTMTIGGAVVGDALFKQLTPITNDLTGHIIAGCGHNIPEEQPKALLQLLIPFLRA
jgi:pimeloyl-ACP methyl ester carboxylesterase